MIASLTNLVSIKRVAAVMVSSVIALRTGSGQQKEQKPTTIADLRNAIEAVLHETRTPGAGIAIVSRDEIEWAAGLGMADVARKRAATAETLFRIGSISKSFAALVVYWHCLVVTGGLLGVAFYYGYWGLIGVRLWA